MANIEPSIGPMHGDHPNAKVNPKKNGGKKFPLFLISSLSRSSFCKKGALSSPIKCSPNRIIKRPDKYLISFLKIKKMDPMELATNPSKIKTVDSPREKAIEQ